MDMKKEVHVSAKDLMAMVRMEPGKVGTYTIVPGPRERLQSIVAKLERPAEDFSYLEHTMYTGFYKGTKVTAVNGGMYSPQGAIMAEIVCAAGTKCIIRTGSCGALAENIAIGDLVIVTGAVRGEGTTPYYVPANFSTVADVRVTAALMKAAESLGVTCHLGLVWTTDALLRETRERVGEMTALKVKAVDMVSSSILTIAQLNEVAAGSILAVSDNLITGELGFMSPRYYATEEKMIDIALEAVSILEGK
jgi:uridine phosphorylase